MRLPAIRCDKCGYTHVGDKPEVKQDPYGLGIKSLSPERGENARFVYPFSVYEHKVRDSVTHYLDLCGTCLGVEFGRLLDAMSADEQVALVKEIKAK